MTDIRLPMYRGDNYGDWPSEDQEGHFRAREEAEAEIKLELEKADSEKLAKNQCPDSKEDEMIKEPSHYSRFVIEPCTFVMENRLSFARGNVVKYITRAGYKKYDDLSLDQSEIRDLKKAMRYIEMEINLLEGKDKL